MTNELHPYRAYKESGLPWLGKVPSHWRLVTLRRVAKVQLSNVDKHTLEGEDPIRLCNYTDVYHHRYIRPDHRFMKATALPREIEKFELQGGDVLITKDSEDWKDIAVPALVTEDMPGVLCGYHLAHIRPGEELYGEYLMWACRSESVALQFRTAANGVTRYGVSGPDIKASLLPLPPIDEQMAIGFYLRKMEQKINRFIHNRRRLIEVLNEQKQAIINRAVTRGLDTNVTLKPSGIDWMGDIPEHWEVLPLRRVTLTRCDGPFGSSLKSSHYVDSGVRVIRLQNIGWAEFKDSDRAFISMEYGTMLANHEVQAGDVLIAGLGDDRIMPGRACVAPKNILPAIVKADCFRFRLDARRVDSIFASLQLSSTARHIAGSMSTGATRQRVNLQGTSSRPLILPPISEQRIIVAAIRQGMATISQAINKTEREIQLIHEYRTRLITDVVTGKLDVRNLGQDMVGELLETEDLDEGIDDEGRLGEEEYGFGEEAIE